MAVQRHECRFWMENSRRGVAVRCTLSPFWCVLGFFFWKQMQGCVEGNFKMVTFPLAETEERISQRGSQAAQTEMEEQRAGNAKHTGSHLRCPYIDDIPHI